MRKVAKLVVVWSEGNRNPFVRTAQILIFVHSTRMHPILSVRHTNTSKNVSQSSKEAGVGLLKLGGQAKISHQTRSQ
jgi:hypothetical protein